MQHRSTVTPSEGADRLRDVRRAYESKAVDWNEAETRFHFIDELLVHCLGWPRDLIHVEKHLGGEYADYILGTPGNVIIEAKREGAYFTLPAGTRTTKGGQT